MKIAVASDDGVSISRHFGRSKCFVVFEIQDNVVIGQALRENQFTSHAKGECNEGHHHQHDQPHSHAGIVEALRDCETVLCHGMGWRAAEELKQNGISPFIVQEEMLPEQAVEAFLRHELGPAGGFCRCHE